MRSTPLIRKFYRLKRSRLKVKTTKSLLLKDCTKLFNKIILKERINKCEWCGRTKRLNIGHILPKGQYPRLRYFKQNVILFCFPCHPPRWHNNPLEAAKFMLETRGENYREKLLVYDKILPRLTNIQIGLYILAFKQEINLRRNVQNTSSSQSPHTPD